MYVHLGNNLVVQTERIIGIFDMDTATMCEATKKMLRAAEQDGRLETVREGEIPKSFVITDDDKVYVSQISASTLIGRAESFGLDLKKCGYLRRECGKKSRAAKKRG